MKNQQVNQQTLFSTPEQEPFAQRLVGVLNESLQSLPNDVSSRLGQARRLALLKKRHRSPAWVSLSNIVSNSPQTGETSWLSRAFAVVPALAMVAGIAFMADQQLSRTAQELAEIDSQVLTDELPLSAYLDQGFTLFVKQVHENPVLPQVDPSEPNASDAFFDTSPDAADTLHELAPAPDLERRI